jgi:hypothetical protein
MNGSEITGLVGSDKRQNPIASFYCDVQNTYLKIGISFGFAKIINSLGADSQTFECFLKTIDGEILHHLRINNHGYLFDTVNRITLEDFGIKKLTIWSNKNG